MARIVLAMSGGVDSSVAAWLLREQGHDVVGVFMRHGIAAEEACRVDASPLKIHKQGCCSASDADDARRVAGMLDIPFYALNFEAEFGRIVDYFVDQYTAGRTPNPCVVCNTWLKFGKLFDYADGIGAEYVATGHHARMLATEDPASPATATVQKRGLAPSPTSAVPQKTAHREVPVPVFEPALCRGRDASKDQSYVLFGVQRRYLSRLRLPVGEYQKDEIRRFAGELGFRVAEKKDSQEICFVPDQDHARFVRQHRGGGETAGEIVTTDGTVVGRHDGLERFTIGQRKGLGIAFGQPRFVVRIEPESRRVVIGTHDELARSELTACGANWLVDPPSEPFGCQVKIRYRSPAMPAMVEPLPGGRLRVAFDGPCYGVAPGQAAVCYQGDRVLGGGWIE